MAKLISGEISAGVLPINVAAKLYNLGVPIKAVAVVGNGMVKLISRQPAVKSLSDLKGKVVHIAGQKATPDYIFRFLMEKAGLVAGKDYTAVYSLAYPEIAAQIASGTIHYAVLPEPFATQAMILNPSLTLTANLDALWHDWTGQRTYPMSIFVASESLIKRIPDLLAELVRAYADSIHRTISEPEATAILAETLDLGMKAIISKNSIPNSAFEFVPAGKARSSIERMLTVFLDFEAQSIGGKLPSADFYFVLQ
jgi:NitT/TauT family transport system substrate-binding protein